MPRGAITKASIKGLSEKQRILALHFASHVDVARAAEEAGYSVTGARKTLSTLKVASYVMELMEEKARRTQIDGEWIVERLVEIVERAMEKVPVLDKAGNPTGVWSFQGAVAVSALRELKDHFRPPPGALPPGQDNPRIINMPEQSWERIQADAQRRLENEG